MNSGLQELGAVFRSKREEMKLSLKEIESNLSIRMVYLQAIEEGRIGHFLSNAYALGFMRQYASFLGLDSEKLLKEYPDLRLPAEKQDFAYGIGTLEIRGTPHGGVRWMPNLLWGGAFVVMLIGAYYFAKFVGLF
jgi:transcriptional regulator with XRE-family HTH domain